MSQRATEQEALCPPRTHRPFVPDHPFVLFNLGMTHADMGEHGTAEGFLRRCLIVSRPDESHVRKAYALLIVSLQEQDRLDDAWTANCQGLELFAADPELLFLRGTLAHRLGRRELAAEAYRGALANRDQRHFSSIDPGVLGYKARHNRAFLFEHGDPCEADEPLRRLIELCPNDGAARHNLGVLNLRAGKPVEAAHWFRESLRVRPHCAATRQQLSMLGEDGKAVVGKGMQGREMQ